MWYGDRLSSKLFVLLEGFFRELEQDDRRNKIDRLNCFNLRFADDVVLFSINAYLRIDGKDSIKLMQIKW